MPAWKVGSTSEIDSLVGCLMRKRNWESIYSTSIHVHRMIGLTKAVQSSIHVPSSLAAKISIGFSGKRSPEGGRYLKSFGKMVMRADSDEFGLGR
jgi:hypothetical protein